MSTTCYWPSGDQIPPSLNYSPCPANPIPGRDTTHVACCDSSAVCTDQGLCIGNANYFYRGGCTDKTWGSSACATACVASLSNDDFDQGGFVNVVPCGNGTRATEWCCESAGGGGESCCAAASSMLLGRPYALLETSTSTSTSAFTSAASSISSTSTSTASAITSLSSTAAAATAVSIGAADASSTTPAASSSSGGRTIGLGVGLGLGLGLLLIVLMGFFILKERKRRVQLEKQVQELDRKVETPNNVEQEKVSPKNELPNYSSGRISEVPGGGAPRYEVAG